MSFETVNNSFNQLTISNPASEANLSEFPFTELPNEFIVEIFSFISEEDQIFNLSLVSRRFYVLMQAAHPERTVPDRVAAAIDKIANLAKRKTGEFYLTPEQKLLLKEGSLLPVNAANVPSRRAARIHHLYSSLANAARHLVTTTPNSMISLGNAVGKKLGPDSNLFKLIMYIICGTTALKEAGAPNPPMDRSKLCGSLHLVAAGKFDEALQLIQTIQPGQLFIMVILVITRAFVKAGRAQDSVFVSKRSQHPVFTPDRIQQLAQSSQLSEEEYISLRKVDSPGTPDEQIRAELEPNDLDLDANFTTKNCDDIGVIHWPLID